MTKKTKILAGILAMVLLAGATTTVVCLSRDKDPAPQGQESVQPNESVGSVTDENGEVLSEGVNVMPTRMTFRTYAHDPKTARCGASWTKVLTSFFIASWCDERPNIRRVPPCLVRCR